MGEIAIGCLIVREGCANAVSVALLLLIREQPRVVLPWGCRNLLCAWPDVPQHLGLFFDILRNLIWAVCPKVKLQQSALKLPDLVLCGV